MKEDECKNIITQNQNDKQAIKTDFNEKDDLIQNQTQISKIKEQQEYILNKQDLDQQSNLVENDLSYQRQEIEQFELQCLQSKKIKLYQSKSRSDSLRSDENINKLQPNQEQVLDPDDSILTQNKSVQNTCEIQQIDDSAVDQEPKIRKQVKIDDVKKVSIEISHLQQKINKKLVIKVKTQINKLEIMINEIEQQLPQHIRIAMNDTQSIFDKFSVQQRLESLLHFYQQY